MKTKNELWRYSLIILVIFSVLASGYKRDENHSNYKLKYLSETLTDIDGNVYKTIKIGTQTWMAENLKVTHYRNGEPIPNVANVTAWGAGSTGAYCNYDNNENNSKTYGRLYNCYAVNDSRKLAPAGWHVPTDDEWSILINYLGGENVAGDKLKETGETHWGKGNEGVTTNETSFTGIPGGRRDSYGAFADTGDCCFFWSSTVYNNNEAWYREMRYYGSTVYRSEYSKNAGLSVRCIKDN